MEFPEILENFNKLPKWISKKWAAKLEMMAWAILIFGIGIETLAGQIARIISDVEIAELGKEAEAAKGSAAQAIESAAALQKEVAQANEHAASLEKDAANARLETEKIRDAEEEDQKNVLLMQSLMAQKAPDLSKEFPLGYSVLTVSGPNQITPFIDPLGKSLVANWNKCKVLEVTHDFIKLQMPDLIITGNKTQLNEDFVTIPNRPSIIRLPFQASTKGSAGSIISQSPLNIPGGPVSLIAFPSPDIFIVVEILEIENERRIIVIGIQPFSTNREITDAQQQIFANELSNVPNKDNVEVAVSTIDPEISQYASRIAELLTSVGFKNVNVGVAVPPLEEPTPAPPPTLFHFHRQTSSDIFPSGITILVENLTRPPAMANILWTALSDIGIKATGASNKTLANDQSVVLIIGKNPDLPASNGPP